MRSVLVFLAVAAGCATDEEPTPAPVITAIEPEAICSNDRVFVGIRGDGFIVDDDHTVKSVVELWRNGRRDAAKIPMLEPDRDGGSMTLLFQNGELGPASSEPPVVFEVRVVNPDGQYAIHQNSFSIHTNMGFGPISPTTASAGSVVTMGLAGNGFYGPLQVMIETMVPTFATEVRVTSPTTATATIDLSGVDPGTYAVTVRNAGRCSYTRVSAFTVTP
ncbi:MAG: hypothetical protein H0T46_35920 [Deltaproteobacteria bacterium]|nr:hypothetical protein [Deltaproteobacteria bacterium]